MLAFIGWYGHGNCGDESFRYAHRHLFPGTELAWSDDARKVGNIQATYVLGGGDVVLDHYLGTLPPHSGFFIYGAGLGSPDQIGTIQALRSRLRGVWLRNKADVAALNALGIPARFTPDVFFQVADQRPETLPRLPLPPKKRKRLVVIPSNTAYQSALRTGNTGEYFYYQYLKITLAKSLSYLSKYYEIVFIPLSHDHNHCDIHFAQEVVSLMPDKADLVVIKDELDAFSVMQIIRDSEMVFSMKFHGLVFSVAAEVPFINIGLTRKTQLFCDENGLSDLSIRPYCFSYDAIVKILKVGEDGSTRDRIAAIRNKLIPLTKDEGQRFADAVNAHAG